jgi:hypothetical protein
LNVSIDFLVGTVSRRTSSTIKTGRLIWTILLHIGIIDALLQKIFLIYLLSNAYYYLLRLQNPLYNALSIDRKSVV